MAATTKLLAPINDTDANFRLWGKAISDQMSAGGWVKTADAGQIDWASVAKPAASSTIAGYEIWRSNDGNASKHEIFVKKEYGSSSAAQINPALWLTVGFSSDGAGAINSTHLIPRTQVIPSGSSASLRNCNLAAGAGWLAIAMFCDSTSGSFFSIERTMNNDLTEKDEVLFLYNKYNTPVGLISRVLNYATGVYPEETADTAQARVNPANAVQSGNAGFSLQFGQRGGLTNPSRNAFGAGTATLGALQTVIQIESYGALRNYIINPAHPHFATNQHIVSRFE